MKCCGVDISGSDVVLVTVERDSKGEICLISEATSRLTLHDSSNQGAVHAFANAIATFAQNNNIQVFAIRGRASKGQFAGGGTSFKIEGLIQIVDSCKTVIISPQSIAARQRKSSFSAPETTHKYQHDACIVACCYLMD